MSYSAGFSSRVAERQFGISPRAESHLTVSADALTWFCVVISATYILLESITAETQQSCYQMHAHGFSGAAMTACGLGSGG